MLLDWSIALDANNPLLKKAICSLCFWVVAKPLSTNCI